MIFECQFCGKKYESASEYAKCMGKCAAKYEKEQEVKNQREKSLIEKENEIKREYEVLKKVISEYYNIGGKKSIKSTLNIGDKVCDCSTPCQNKNFKFNNVWVDTTNKTFTIPKDVKIEYYDKAEDIYKASSQKNKNKEKKNKKNDSRDESLEDLLKRILDEEKFKPKESIWFCDILDDILKEVHGYKKFPDKKATILDFKPKRDETYFDLFEFLKELEKNINEK